MKSQDILMIFLILILLFPSSPMVTPKDVFSLYAAEGMVATQIFSQDGTDLKPQPDEVPVPNPDKKYKCEKCKDLGYITTGDGIHKFPCPDCKVPKVTGCPCNKPNCNKEKCECPKTVAECAPPPKVETKIFTEVKESTVTAILFTQPPTCPPCKKYENEVKPELVKRGIKISKDKDAVIREVDPTRGTAEESALWAQYSGLGNGGIPMFVYIKDGKVVEFKNGFMTLNETLKSLGK